MKEWLKKITSAIIAVVIIAFSFIPIAVQWDSDVSTKIDIQYQKVNSLYERLVSFYMNDEQKEVYLYGTK